MAELNISIVDPSGHTIGFDVEPSANGQRVIYVPECPGTHKVNATYGGINVPGNLENIMSFYIIFLYCSCTFNAVCQHHSWLGGLSADKYAVMQKPSTSVPLELRKLLN